MQTITAYTEDSTQIEVLKAIIKALKIKYTITKKEEKEGVYNPEFVAKILESKEQAKNGKVTRVAKDDLKDFLGM